LIDTDPDVTIVNLDCRWSNSGNIRYVRCDGTMLPFSDGSFDLCYSNSVIEHVGDFDKMRLLASEIRRVAPSYFVQTPNRHFFIEPHFICPFIHWLPRRIYRRLIRYFSVWGLASKATQASIDEALTMRWK
jgi:ubiquinone/menaquinone biosynthesis C-methylase UbiE